MAACLVWLFTVSSSNGQELTNNLVYTTLNPSPQGTSSTWNGFISSDTTGGGYSGGHIPAYNPNTGTFMFGYTLGTVSYVTGINAALSAAGTGIQVSGLKYSWQYFNQDYYRGSLTGNISVTNSTGSTIHSYNYQLPQTTNGWTQVTGTENFGTKYAPTSLGNLSVSFTGKDDRFWAGYYGPQIKDIDVRLQYTVAPPPQPTFIAWDKIADENGEFTLTKPAVVRYGAYDTWDLKELQAGTYSCSNGAWGRDPLGGVYKRCELGITSESQQPAPTPLPVKTVEPESVVTVAVIESVEPVTTVELLPPTNNTSTTSEVIQPVQTSPTSSTSATTTAPTSSPVATVTNTTTAQTKVGEITVSGSSVKITPSMSQILSIVRSEQSRVGSVESSAVQQAVEQAQAASDRAQKESVAVSASNIVQSQTSVQGASLITTTNTTQSIVVDDRFSNNFNSNVGKVSGTSSDLNALKAPEVETTSAVTAKGNSIYSLTNIIPEFAFKTDTNTTTSTAYKFETNGQQVEQIGGEGLKPTDVNSLLNITSSQSTVAIQGNEVTATGPTVNVKAQDNDVAKGGLSIATINKQPVGFDSYMNVIPDVAFYAPKEVYRNQKVVDNVRVLRQLSSDRVHREMVEQQYRK